MKRHNVIGVILFCGFLFTIAAGYLLPKPAFSEMEKRYLAEAPDFRWETVSSGEWSSQAEEYLTDHVPGRNLFVGINAYLELLAGRQKLKDVWLVDGKLLEAPVAADEQVISRNMNTINTFAETLGQDVHVMIVPSAGWAAGVEGYTDQDTLNAVYAAAGTGVRTVPVEDLFSGKPEFYYNTDHHWTSLGAYYAYQQLCGALGLTPFDPAAHRALTAENFYGTHYSKARTWNAVPDTITYYDLPNSLTIWNVTAAGQPTDGQTTGLYDTDKLNVYDKYAMFLHGNNGLSRIEGDGTGRILVIKDSYANCFAPYLTANYAEIDVVDFRNYNYGLDQLIADNDYDQILVLYSFDSFKSDPYLYRAGVAV